MHTSMIGRCLDVLRTRWHLACLTLVVCQVGMAQSQPSAEMDNDAYEEEICPGLALPPVVEPGQHIPFRLDKTREPLTIGDIAVWLRKSDPKRNKFTIDICSDQKLVSKKDRTINEPIAFYVLKSKEPYQLFVTHVGKGTIVGSLEIPGDPKSVRAAMPTSGNAAAVNSSAPGIKGGEIETLKRLGERNILEFNLGKEEHPARVGDIVLWLKEADPEHNRYTVEVYADGRISLERNRTVNEPVQVYTRRSAQSYEIVVNQVRKDQIVGYLSAPKVLEPQGSIDSSLGATSTNESTPSVEGVSETSRVSTTNYDFFEFNLAKAKRPCRFNDVAIFLKMTNYLTQHYTIDVLANDKTTEKKERMLNDPLQVFIAGMTEPYIIVVTSIKPRNLIGYVIAPKRAADQPKTE